MYAHCIQYAHTTHVKAHFSPPHTLTYAQAHGIQYEHTMHTHTYKLYAHTNHKHTTHAKIKLTNYHTMHKHTLQTETMHTHTHTFNIVVIYVCNYVIFFQILYHILITVFLENNIDASGFFSLLLTVSD